MADFLLSNPHMLTASTVMELGSGAGLAGIVAALKASRVFLTDTGSDVLQNCQAPTTQSWQHLHAACTCTE